MHWDKQGVDQISVFFDLEKISHGKIIHDKKGWIQFGEGLKPGKRQATKNDDSKWSPFYIV